MTRNRQRLALLSAAVLFILSLVLPQPFKGIIFLGLIAAFVWSVLTLTRYFPLILFYHALLLIFDLLRAPYLNYRDWHTSSSRPAPPGSTPLIFNYLISAALLSGLLLALMLFEAEPLAGAFMLLLAAFILFIGLFTRLDMLILPRALVRWLTWDNPGIPPLSRRQQALEVLFIIALSLFLTRAFYTGPEVQMTGGETEWITSSVYSAHIGLRQYGRIPLWQPFLEFGEPLLDNPVGFILNPFSSVPSLILGGIQGVKLSIALTTALAGVGGWFLARILGLGLLARLLLALLLLGKGNMYSMFNSAYFQLASAQAYFPWVVGGLLAIFRLPERRWPVVLSALAYTLLFFAGNLWYTLPLAIIAVALVAINLIRKPFDYAALRRVMLAGALTAGLSAALLLPIGINHHHIGRHPSEFEAGWVVSPRYVLSFFVNADPYQTFEVLNPHTRGSQGYVLNGLREHYYTYVIPPWFLALIFLLIPLYRSGGNRRFWLLSCLLLVFFTLWGVGGQPLFLWLYAHAPLIDGWRFVGRALAVASFFIAVLVALRVDNLWRAIVTTRWTSRHLRPSSARMLMSILGGVLAGSTLYAGWLTAALWQSGHFENFDRAHVDTACVDWLRERRPNDHLAVWRLGYTGIRPYIDNNVRVARIYADFEMSPMPSTIGALDLTYSMPAWGIAFDESERAFLNSQQYRVVWDGPRIPLGQARGYRCLYYKDDALPYAYTVSREAIENASAPSPIPHHILIPTTRATLDPALVQPVSTLERHTDYIALVVQATPDEPLVLTLQERAYPGWRVEIDGHPAQLESVGGQIGVLLPQDAAWHTVYFEYRPPLLLWGGVITILSALFSAAYLLRLEKRASVFPNIIRKAFGLNHPTEVQNV